MPPIGRRTVLKLVAGSVAGGLAWACLPMAMAAPRRAGSGSAQDPGRPGDAEIGDAALAIAFDRSMHTRLTAYGKPLTPHQPSESLLLADGAVEDFVLTGHEERPIEDARHGRGRQSVTTGRAGAIEKEVSVTFFDALPGLAMLQTRYRNHGNAPLEVAGWRNAGHELAEAPGGFWSFSGATHTDRRDWVQPVGAGFDQRNTLAMDSSDYGGGTPLANIWRRDVGLAVGHLETVVRPLDMPV